VSDIIGFPQKSPSALLTLTFDFSSLSTPGVTLSAAFSSIEVWAGVDPNPSAVLLGAPTFNGPYAFQQVNNGVNGCIYKIKMLADTNDVPGQALVLFGYLAIVEDPL